MEWQYKLSLSPLPVRVHAADAWFMTGSCFAGYLAEELNSHLFPVFSHPMGVVYHPEAMLEQLKLIVSGDGVGKDDLFFREGLYGHFLFHSFYSGQSSAGVLDNMNVRLKEAALKLKQAAVVVLTPGTAKGYYLKENMRSVANCHKFPSHVFVEKRIGVEECTAIFKEMAACIHAVNPAAQLVVSISPVKYYREGAREQLLSKSVLLLAAKEAEELGFTYFPAYELMTEELRDYRFYADDYCHPSNAAAKYITSKFLDGALSDNGRSLYKMAGEYLALCRHRMLHPHAEAARQHINKIQVLREKLSAAFPHVKLLPEFSKNDVSHDNNPF